MWAWLHLHNTIQHTNTQTHKHTPRHTHRHTHKQTTKHNRHTNTRVRRTKGICRHPWIYSHLISQSTTVSVHVKITYLCTYCRCLNCYHWARGLRIPLMVGWLWLCKLDVNFQNCHDIFGDEHYFHAYKFCYRRVRGRQELCDRAQQGWSAPTDHVCCVTDLQTPLWHQICQSFMMWCWVHCVCAFVYVWVSACQCLYVCM